MGPAGNFRVSKPPPALRNPRKPVSNVKSLILGVQAFRV